MKCCFALLLWGLLVTIDVRAYPAGSCDGYTNISQAWRHALSSSEYFENNPYDDSFMVSQWWRFVGPAGDMLITICKGFPTGDKFSNSLTGPQMPTSPLFTVTKVTAYVNDANCGFATFFVDVVMCPGGFYVYRPLSHPASSSYATFHSACGPNVCGPNAACAPFGGGGLCNCLSGYTYERKLLPPDDVICIDIDECEDVDLCTNGNCTNTEGSFNCTCSPGYELQYPADPPSLNNKCTDINECLNASACDAHADCVNAIGNYSCACHQGFYSDHLECKDIDECVDETLCGPNSTCNNTIGLYTCTCEVGYRQTNTNYEPSPNNICIDIDECQEDGTICGSNGDCTNTEGSFLCTCSPGYRLDPSLITISDPCLDIDECSETPEICGPKSFCVNKPGSYVCACSDRFFSSTGIVWTVETVCESIPDILNAQGNSQGNSKEKGFFAKMDKQLKENKGKPLHEAIVTNCFSASMEVAGVGPFVNPPKVSSAGDGETGTIILDLSERLIDSLLNDDNGQSGVKVSTSTVDFEGMMFNPNDFKPKSFCLTSGAITMEINIEELASKNNDFAAVALMRLSGLDNLLSHQYFETENNTQFAADIFSAFLPRMSNTNLTDVVNFTILHEELLPGQGVMTCTYWMTDQMDWEGSEKSPGISASGVWSEEGCWVSYSGVNYTVCSCSHFSTFALIMQIGEPAPQSDFLDWLNRICVIIGLFFFALAILTFLLCSWNPKINNTARLHLCLNLGLSHLLLLFNEHFYPDKLACKVIAGILHFLVVASFVWMLLEALQLYMLVRRLNKVQVIERDGLPKLVLFFIGYGVPLLVVGVSALVYHPGYGATGANVCWLSTTRNFNWALTGPVITILVLNLILFCATLWTLRTTLANMRKGASDSKDAKLVLFKIVAQFVILGCTWILGLYQSNLFFQVLFIVLNSQQGTFLYVVHCMLNKEIREECLKCLSCSHNKKEDKTEGVWTTEEQDNTK